MKLFNRWLAATRELQETAYHRDYSLFDDTSTLVDFIKNMHTATTMELGELLDETSWKPWAQDKPFVNKDLVIKEAVDVLHFIGNILTAVDCTDEELNLRYLEKMALNRQRQLRDGGYRVRGEDSDKCAICKRALDDVGSDPNNKNVCMFCAPIGYNL
jgi:hypothetical protein